MMNNDELAELGKDQSRRDLLDPKEVEQAKQINEQRNAIEANEAAKRFLKAHHERIAFKSSSNLVQRVKQDSTESKIPSSALEKPEIAIIDTPAMIKDAIKRKFADSLNAQLNKSAITKIRPPEIINRTVGGIIDLTLSTLSAAILTTAYVLLFEPGFRSQILVPSLWDQSDIQIFSGIFLGMLILALVIYPLLSSWFLTRTIGQLITHQKILRYGQVVSNREDLVLRALNLPLSYLLLGVAPILFNKRSLHDFAAGTAVTKD